MTTETIEGQVLDAADSTEAANEATPLKVETLRFAVLDAFAKAFNDYVKAHRDTHLDRLLEAGEDMDTKSFNVRLDGEVIATQTVNEPSDKFTVDDKDTFINWVMDKHPSEVVTEPEVRPAFQKRLLEKNVAVGDDGTVFHKETGEPVPGLKHVPAGQPTSFSTRWKSQDAKVAALSSIVSEVAQQFGLTAADVLGIEGGDQ